MVLTYSSILNKPLLTQLDHKVKIHYGLRKFWPFKKTENDLSLKAELNTKVQLINTTNVYQILVH